MLDGILKSKDYAIDFNDPTQRAAFAGLLLKLEKSRALLAAGKPHGLGQDYQEIVNDSLEAVHSSAAFGIFGATYLSPKLVQMAAADPTLQREIREHAEVIASEGYIDSVIAANKKGGKTDWNAVKDRLTLEIVNATAALPDAVKQSLVAKLAKTLSERIIQTPFPHRSTFSRKRYVRTHHLPLNS